MIGCDNISKLSLILSQFDSQEFDEVSVSTVSRTSDLIRTVESGNVALIILCFRHNQAVLNDLFNTVAPCRFSVFCFTGIYDQESLKWGMDQCVFTYPFELAAKENSFKARIRSVLKMEENTESITDSLSDHLGGGIAIDASKNLSRYILELDQKREILDKVVSRIKDIYPHAKDETRLELLSVVNTIKSIKNNAGFWDDFKQYFENINPGFLDFLSEKHPHLTSKDLKYCCYLKMNMSNNDITHLLGINQESVRTHKYRLKKKMALSKHENLEHYLKTFSRLNAKSAS